MRQISKAEFKDPNLRYREWYQGCGGKVVATAAQSVESQLAGLEATGEWIAEPKRDGIWAVAFFDDTGVQFFSRTCERKPYSLDKLIVPDLFGCALVGELGFGSQESLRRRAELGADFFDVYDLLAVDYRVVTYENDGARRHLLEGVMARSVPPQLLPIPQYASNFVAEYAKQPEGLIIKPREEGFAYQPGRKVKHWVKVKKDHTVDMVVMGYEVSTAETKAGKGMVEHIICGMFVDAELVPLVKVGGMPHEMQVDIVANWSKYAGRVVELKHFGQFKSGSLRHPSVVRMREDKRADACIFDPDSVSPKNFKCVSRGDEDADTVE